jgi:uncharacterized short protein YbdD (DUF466 family)
MRLLRSLRRIMEQMTGEADYARYCEHLRLRHPGTRPPTEKEFYLARVEAQYSRPSRCC